MKPVCENPNSRISTRALSGTVRVTKGAQTYPKSVMATFDKFYAI
jgi:hypothetical protein